MTSQPLSLPNFRSLGGIAAADGRTVRPNLLFRSSSLHAATDHDLALLDGLCAIRCVIDLRTPAEAAKDPDRLLPGWQYIPLPIADSSNNIWAEVDKEEGDDLMSRFFAFVRTDKGRAMASRIYVGFVENPGCQRQFAAFLAAVAGLDRGACLWHCSQGKDRTGLCSAFLLSALGCSRGVVMDDFAASHAAYQPLADRVCHILRSRGGTPDDAAVVSALVGVSADYFALALNHIDRRYGGMDGYLSAVLGLSAPARERLRDKYLTPAPRL